MSLIFLIYSYRVAMRERFVDVEISLPGHHQHSVEAACQRHLGERQDVGDQARFGLLAELGRQAGEAVEQQHPNLTQSREFMTNNHSRLI